jgi:hypothetical protein
MPLNSPWVHPYADHDKPAADQTAAAQAQLAAWQPPEPPPGQAAPEPRAANQAHPDWAAVRLRANPPPAASLGRAVNSMGIDTLATVACEITQPRPATPRSAAPASPTVIPPPDPLSGPYPTTSHKRIAPDGQTRACLHRRDRVGS